MENPEYRFRKYALAGALTIFAGAIAFGTYAKIWEHNQPKQPIEDPKVLSIDPYRSHNDLHWSAKGYRISIDKKDKPIDFSAEDWDDNIEEGDTIDRLVIRENFPLFGDEWDGIRIDKKE